MGNQLETTDRQSKRRGFFDRPAGVDFWMKALLSGRLKKRSWPARKAWSFTNNSSSTSPTGPSFIRHWLKKWDKTLKPLWKSKDFQEAVAELEAMLKK